MADLIHGGDIYSAKERGVENILDFSANINPRGLPERVKEEIVKGLDLCVNYPDPLCRELLSAISAFEGISKDCIFCGNGAADIIFRLVLALKPKKALVLAPTFAEYETALHTVGCEVLHYGLHEEACFSVKEDFIQSLEDSLDVIFLCNPNNPTGQMISRELLEKILQVCVEKKILLVLDECFIEFVENSEDYTMKGYIEDCKFLFILKAFTKSYAMPGLRLGYGISCDAALMQKIADMGQPWSVSVLAQIAGVQALQETAYMKDSMEEIRQERNYLSAALDKLGIKSYPPSANYILFKIEDDAARGTSAFQGKLLEKGIMIRNCSNYKGLGKGYYRIAVKSHDDNERLIAAMGSII